MKKKFFKFLKMHNLTKMYEKEMKKNRPNFPTITSFIHKRNPRNYIGGVFLWDHTEQGWSFWNVFNNLWEDYIKDDIKDE